VILVFFMIVAGVFNIRICSAINKLCSLIFTRVGSLYIFLIFDSSFYILNVSVGSKSFVKFLNYILSPYACNFSCHFCNVLIVLCRMAWLLALYNVSNSKYLVALCWIWCLYAKKLLGARYFGCSINHLTHC